MKLFLDTGSVQEIKEAVAMGLLDGVTTNPTLVGKEKRPFRDLVDEICRTVDGPVSLEVVATDMAGMITQGRELAKIAPNGVVKLPTTVEGLKALRVLRDEGWPDQPDPVLLAGPGPPGGQGRGHLREPVPGPSR